MAFRFAIAVFALLVFSTFIMAATEGGEKEKLEVMLKCVGYYMRTLLSTIAMLLVVLAAVFYAAGNFFGAEFRAKAQGYAMACLVGAVIGFLVWTIGPVIIQKMYDIEENPQDWTCG